MKKYKWYIITATVLVIIVLSVFLCLAVVVKVSSNFHDQAKEEEYLEFSKYETDNSVALVHDNSSVDIYIKNSLNGELRFEDLFEKNRWFIQHKWFEAFTVIDNNVYYAVSLRSGWSTQDLGVYKYDLNDDSLVEIFNKPLDAKIEDFSCLFNGSELFLQYYLNDVSDPSDRRIESYDVITGEYKTVSKGASSSLSDYKKAEMPNVYSYEIKDGAFVITDTETSEIAVVDNNTLKSSIYAETFSRYSKITPVRMDVSQGHLLLSYDITANNERAKFRAIFEYDMETEELTYKVLAFFYEDLEDFIHVLYFE